MNHTPSAESQLKQANLAKAESSAELNPYDMTFVWIYAANLAFMMSYGLLFRYSDFVAAYGGDDTDLARLVSVAALGSLALRIWLGGLIDRWGAGRIWLGSLSLWMLAVLAHLTVESATAGTTYLARLAMQCGMAGFFGSSLTFLSLRVGLRRLAEVIGVLGTAGFIGMGLAPIIGDWILYDFAAGDLAAQKAAITQMFIASLMCAAVSMLSVLLAVRDSSPAVRPATHREPLPPLLQVIGRYHPGLPLLFAIVMGVGISFPPAFVRPLAQSKGVDSVFVFFMTYAIAAFLLRLASRRLPQLWGLPLMAAGGFACLAVSMPLYSMVRSPWDLAYAAIAAGAAHALLFPSVIAMCSQTFPDRFRGTATTLSLAMIDVGNLMGAATVGWLLEADLGMGAPSPDWQYVRIQLVFGVLFFVVMILVSRPSFSCGLSGRSHD